MPDWLTHVLVGYALATALAALRTDVQRRHVTLAMAGALLPDASKLDLLVASETVGEVLGLPFEWFALHTLPATVVLAAGVAVLLPARSRRLGFALLLLGGCSHHALDLLLVQPSGSTYPVLWPLSNLRVAAPGVYASTDLEPALVAALLAGLAALARSRRGTRLPSRGDAGEESANGR